MQDTIRQKADLLEDLITIVKKWYDHMIRTNTLSTGILHSIIIGNKRWGRQKKTCWCQWADWKILLRFRYWNATEGGGLFGCSATKKSSDYTKAGDWWQWKVIRKHINSNFCELLSQFENFLCTTQFFIELEIFNFTHTSTHPNTPVSFM